MKESKISKEYSDLSEDELLSIEKRIKNALLAKAEEKRIRKQNKIKEFWKSITDEKFKEILLHVSHDMSDGHHDDTSFWEVEICNRCLLLKAQQGCYPDNQIFKLDIIFFEPNE